MTWNYRLIRDENGWGIFEVYYDHGKPIALTQDPMFGYYESRDEVVDDLNMMLDGTKLLPLTYDDSGFGVIQ